VRPLSSQLTSHSGVDATIADDKAYLSNVFGLRAAPPPPEVHPSRSASHGSNTNSSRSTSGNSIVYMRSKPKQHNLISAHDGQGGTQGGRPLVVRDPYQNIGIRKGIGMKDIPEEAGRKIDMAVEVGTCIS